MNPPAPRPAGPAPVTPRLASPAPAAREPAALVVGGESALGQAVAARLAAVARVVLGEVDPARLGPALAEVERVRALYGRADVPALSVGRDVAALVRSARRLLPAGHAVVVVEPPPALGLDGLIRATAPGTTVVVVTRSLRPADSGPRREGLGGGRTLCRVAVEAPAVPGWGGGRDAAAADAAAARAVRDLLFPLPDTDAPSAPPSR